MSDIEVVQTLLPAFDEKDHPTGNYGVGAVQYYIALNGPEGAVSWDLSTGLYLDGIENAGGATAGPVSVHHPTPQEHIDPVEECRFMEGKCWGTHHYLAGDDVLARLKEEGLRGVCCALLDFYNHRFETNRLLGDLDVPDWTVQEDPHGFEAMRETA